MEKLKVLDLFSGIGGFSLGLERTSGFETVVFCEIEKYPQKVLKKHWPEIPIYEDVREVTKERLDADGIGRIDVITGGFPCQDISVAGKQAGIHEGERSSLFNEIIRIVGEYRPRYVVCENVAALLSGNNGQWFSYVLSEFSRIGYDVEWESISAQQVGAWHKRDRVWFMGYPKSESSNGLQSDRENSECEIPESGNTSSKRDIPNTNSERLQRREKCGIFEKCGEGWKQLFTRQIRGFEEISTVEPTICGITNGIPRRVDRLKCLGNAVVPQVVELIGYAILESLNDYP